MGTVKLKLCTLRDLRLWFGVPIPGPECGRAMYQVQLSGAPVYACPRCDCIDVVMDAEDVSGSE